MRVLVSILFLFRMSIQGSIASETEAMVPFSVEELAKKADVVALGTVESATVKRDEQKRIYTEIEFVVEEVWKGAYKPKSLKIVHSGGTLGEERVEVSGQVNYKPGEQAVAFVVFNKRGEAVTYAMTQGKFAVTKDKTGERFAHNPFHGASPSGAKSGPKLRLSDLKTKVQQAK